MVIYIHNNYYIYETLVNLCMTVSAGNIDYTHIPIIYTQFMRYGTVVRLMLRGISNSLHGKSSGQLHQKLDEKSNQY